MFALICALALLVSSAVRAGDSSTQDKAAKEYELKSAFIFKFSSYVTWPKDAFENDKSPFVVGVFGWDPFDGKLEEVLKDKKVDAHPIVVKHLARFEDTAKCHILFVGSSESDNLARLVEMNRGKSVLLVGESLDFAERGGCIGMFVGEEKKLHVVINSRVAKSATFKISSGLMKVATLVGDKDESK